MMKSIASSKIPNKMSKRDLKKLYQLVNDYFEYCEKYGLQLREGQYDMALSVYDAIESQEHLVIEAGVGIGKSYAYLIPLLFYHDITGKPFIISTSTIALQEQLEKDIKKLSKQLDIPIEVVVAKGMGNFLCLNRLMELNHREPDLASKFIKTLQDRKDYPEIKDNEWKKVCVENCAHTNCVNYPFCEFYSRREQMKGTSGAIICNHDLLILDLDRKNNYSGRNLFKKVDYIVCDEAHNLENKVRSFETREIDLLSIKKVISKAINVLARFNNYDYKYDNVVALLNQLIKIISSNVDKRIEELKKSGIDVIDCNGIDMHFDSEIVALADKLYVTLSDMLDLIQMHTDSEEELESELYNKVGMLSVLADGISSNNIFWIEHKGGKNYIYYAPKNINDIAYDLFFNRRSYYKGLSDSVKTFIFTSATLSVGENDYSYFLNNIGADKVNGESLAVEYSYESPYDYDNNAILYAVGDIENPVKDKQKYLDQLTEKIDELIRITNGKTLVLFTSKSDMNYVYERINNTIDGINIYIQNDGSSQDEVKNKFKNDINSVLFSTGIFWEGIDIKGESLSSLIIARLPFPVVDPIMEYKKSVYGDEGFKRVYLPEMLIKLKQGVGRLIRSEEDKGIVSILDSRMSTKYKEIVRNSLPIKNITSDIEEVKKLVKKFNI